MTRITREEIERVYRARREHDLSTPLEPRKERLLRRQMLRKQRMCKAEARNIKAIQEFEQLDLPQVHVSTESGQKSVPGPVVEREEKTEEDRRR